MSLTTSQGKGVTVITISSNPNSKWPILCQILGILCYSPVCGISQHVKSKMTGVYTALGIVQIVVGILNIVAWSLFLNFDILNHIMMSDIPFWFGSVFLVIGIVSVAAAWFPSTFHPLDAVVMNIVSTVLAVIGLALYSCDLSVVPYRDHRTEMIREALDVTMIIFSALQICVTLSFSVLTVTSFKTNISAKSVEDPQIYKPLKEDVTTTYERKNNIYIVN